MNKTYRIFGMNIISALPLPACPQLADFTSSITPDVIIEFGASPTALLNPRFKGVRFQADAEKFLLQVDGVARYYVQNGNRIIITPHGTANEDDILIFLMGSAIGALLHQRNILVLHASAISANGECVIFAGPSGIGKSTLAAAFHQRGYPFLSDDVCAISTFQGHPAVMAGFPRLKLWPDVLKKLKIDERALKKVRWNKDMEKYFYHIEEHQDTPVPVKSIFILETTETEKTEISPLRGTFKIDPIFENTYRRRFLEGLSGKKEHFHQCAAVASRTNVYRAIRPRNSFHLNELMDQVEKNFLS